MGSHGKHWAPVLSGDLAREALGAVDDVAKDLRLTFCADPAGPAWSHFSERYGSLSGGQAGLALFFSYLDRSQPDRGNDVIAANCLDRAIEWMSSAETSVGLFTGFAGVAWALEHLRAEIVDPQAEDLGADVATFLLKLADETPWQGELDLIEGLAGLCLYGLERLPLPDSRELIEATATRLYEAAVIRDDGSSWLTAPERLIPMRRGQYPNGNFNLGLAHGVPGIVGALALAEAAGIIQPKNQLVLRDAVRWLRGQRLSPGERSQFPSWVGGTQPPQPTRLAWCYGDLGIALALHAAALAIGEETWEQLALEIARGAAVRPADTCDVVDAGFCHGAAGLGHQFNRLFQKTGDELFREAAVYWLRLTLELRSPGEGVGGFRARGPDRADQETWLADPGLLTGAAGVGLALLSAATDVEPKWDRLFLCSARDDGS
ncbi:MAG: lanthionine synthetase C family protein [Acidobacteriota bacterium]